MSRPTHPADPGGCIGRVVAERYLIDTVIGEGGMGTIYRAHHQETGQTFAVKVLHPAMLEDEDAVARFEREAIAGAHVEHPNVATAIESGQISDGSRFIVLEHLEGHDLRTELMEAPLELAHSLDIARQLTLALIAVHGLGIVHRDLKPENVMLLGGESGPTRVKLLDFGIAKVPIARLAPSLTGRAAEALTRLGVAIGTPEYMAPEQAAGEEVDSRADLYALGVILYECLCGRRPFDEKRGADLRAALLSEDVLPLRKRSSELRIPPRVDMLVLHLLERSRNDRYQGAEELLHDLDVIISELNAPTSKRPEAREPTTLSVARTELPEVTTPAPSTPTPIAPIGGGRGSGAVWLSAVGLAAIIGVVATGVSMRDENAILELEAALDPTPAPSASLTAPPVESSPSPAASSSGPPVEEPPPEVREQASAAELDQARAKGPKALQVLADQYPEDPAVTKELMTTLFEYPGRHQETMRAVLRHLSLAPEDTEDPDMHRFLLLAANGELEPARRAVNVMANQLGTTGPDLLYRLVISEGVGSYPKRLAVEQLKTERVRSQASPALRVALDLRALKKCERKDLIKRASAEGDARAMEYLQPLTRNARCPYANAARCYSCGPQTGHDVERAMSAIRARGGS